MVEDDRRSGAIAGMSAYLLWGFITIYWKALKHFAPLELIGFRITLSTILLVALLAARGRLTAIWRKLRAEKLWRTVVMAALLLSVNWTSYVMVVHQGKVIEAALGYFIAPLFTTILGVKVLGEHLRPAQKLSAVLATVAVVVLTVTYGRPPVLALAMAGSWAFYGLFKRRMTLAPMESLFAETVVLVIPAMALVAWHSRLSTSVIQSASAGQFVLVALTGVITAVPLLLFAHAARHLPLTVLAPMQYSVPTINFLLGWLAYNEKLTLSRVVGFGLIWIALLVVTADSLRSARTSARLASST